MAKAFVLPQDLNIYNVQAAREALLAHLAKYDKKPPKDGLLISAAEVSEVDASGLQLLASLAVNYPDWHLTQASDAFAEACRTLGFSRWLEGMRGAVTEGESA